MVARTINLPNGTEMPIIGLGLWKIPQDVCAEQVYEAIKIGYRMFDGAQDYDNEKQVGAGIRRALEEKLVKRDELFVVSKLWNSYHAPEHVELALDRTLDDLGLDYLDLFYIHFPIAFKFVPLEERYPPAFYTGREDEQNKRITTVNVPIIETYRKLEEMVRKGKIRNIGVSNFQGALLQDLLRQCDIKPAALQIEHHPYLTQENLVKYAQSEGICVVAYSSFGPLSFIEMDVASAKDAPPLFENAVIKRIAGKYKCQPSEVLLRWSTQRGVAVIPKSSKKERLHDNLEVESKLELTDEEITEINALNKNLRFNDPWNWLDQHFPTFA